MSQVKQLPARLYRIVWRVVASIVLLIIIFKLTDPFWPPSVSLAWTLPTYPSEASFSKDGRLLFTREAIDKGSLMTIWDAHTGQKMKERTFDVGITAFDVSPDDSDISIVTDKGTMLTINAGSLETEKQVDIVDLQQNRLQNVLYSPTGKLICLIGLKYGDEAISFAQIYDVQTGNRLALLEWPQNFFSPPAAFNADETQLAIGTNPTDIEGILRIWDTSTWQEISNVPMKVILSLAWSPDGNSITLAIAPGQIETLQVASLDKTLAIETRGGVTRLAYSANGCLIFYSGSFVPVQVMDSQTGNLLPILRAVEGTDVDFTLSPKGDLIVIDQLSAISSKGASTSAIWNVANYSRCS